jgi:hypothetical protein
MAFLLECPCHPAWASPADFYGAIEGQVTREGSFSGKGSLPKVFPRGGSLPRAFPEGSVLKNPRRIDALIPPCTLPARYAHAGTTWKLKMDDCKVSQASEEILKAASLLERDLHRLRRLLSRCPACQGCYCPSLLEITPAIAAVLRGLLDTWGLTDDEL